MEKEEKQRERKKVLNDIAVERNARNAHRQRDFELKQLARLVKEDSSINQDMIEEKEVIIKDLNVIIDNKGSVTPACENCTKCEDEKEICNCFCNTCEKNRELKASNKKNNTGRGPVRCVKRIRGRRGKPDTIEYLVNIELDQYQIDKKLLADYKELFAVFDKDQDGVLSLIEVTTAMKTLGQRLPKKELLAMVRQVSEDKTFDTIEFNEFLVMLGKQNMEDIKFESLVEAFGVFDKDKDGYLGVSDLRRIMTTMGQRMKNSEVEEMVTEADIAISDGLINVRDFCSLLCYGRVKTRKVMSSPRDVKRRIQREHKDNYSSRSGSFSQG